MAAYKMPNFGYKCVNFSKFSQIWATIGLDFRKFWKNCVILLKILPQIKQIGQYFLKTWYLFGIFIGLLSKPAAAHPYQNQTWVPPWGLEMTYFSFFKFQSFRLRSNSKFDLGKDVAL